MANTIDKLNKARLGNHPGALCFVDSKKSAERNLGRNTVDSDDIYTHWKVRQRHRTARKVVNHSVLILTFYDYTATFASDGHATTNQSIIYTTGNAVSYTHLTLPTICSV